MDSNNALSLWEDAKAQMSIKVESWPYDFPASEDPTSDLRGSISGTLLIKDVYIDDEYMSTDSTYVGPTLPREAGSWQRESKGYQFWTMTDKDGNFTISDI
ncbi:Rhamnogalacturonate lyase family protein [Thalictrum thalictroides]|uniref:Rhamnogalacturonate lyase family protein n=1 Tax=Thalictrum thalictroides TaxID=46969 RepID=A0A7J6VGQ9_THATH|nr:Rhamnogalacturonate lyase family protein [Thalictrum thalictroides]